MCTRLFSPQHLSSVTDGLNHCITVDFYQFLWEIMSSNSHLRWLGVVLNSSGSAENQQNLGQNLCTAPEPTKRKKQHSFKVCCFIKYKWPHHCSAAYPCSQTQDELSSLPVVDQARNCLRYHEHKLLQLVVIHDIFLLCQLPHSSRQKLQWGHQETERCQREAWVWNIISVFYRGFSHPGVLMLGRATCLESNPQLHWAPSTQ